jgi:hypothetical protein
MSKQKIAIVPSERIDRSIYLIRDEKVMLSHDLAALYEVETKVFNQAVRRNIDRFPEDFMFQLSKEEYEILRSQFVTSSSGGQQYRPYAFTEQGVAMLSSVLRSERAVKVNIEIMRAFVKLRALLASHEDLRKKIESMEQKYDDQFLDVFDAIREFTAPPKSSRRIGFRVESE